MKVYKVKVNGKVYEVELESVTEKTQEFKAEPKPEPKPQPQPVAPVTGGSLVQVKAPMQGTIITVKVQAGSVVKKGQAVVVLEAMKLENEIVSPTDGVVRQVLVNKGENVANQQVLLTIQ